MCYRARPMSESPQFGTAEYQEQSGPDRCKTCEQPIVDVYYRVSGAMTCTACTERTSGQMPADTKSAFVRGLVFGCIGAILGLILYSVVGIVTGLEIGYVSLAVGYIVGKAIMFGSAGIGGRRYQIAALVLTYAAVSISAIPIAISQSVKEGSHQTEKSQDPASAESSSAPLGAVGVVTSLVVLALFGLASPLLGLSNPLSGLIGLVILYVGLRIAWSSTAGAKVPILGPFKVVPRA